MRLNAGGRHGRIPAPSLTICSQVTQGLEAERRRTPSDRFYITSQPVSLLSERYQLRRRHQAGHDGRTRSPAFNVHCCALRTDINYGELDRTIRAHRSKHWDSNTLPSNPVASQLSTPCGGPEQSGEQLVCCTLLRQSVEGPTVLRSLFLGPCHSRFLPPMPEANFDESDESAPNAVDDEDPTCIRRSIAIDRLSVAAARRQERDRTGLGWMSSKRHQPTGQAMHSARCPGWGAGSALQSIAIDFGPAQVVRCKTPCRAIESLPLTILYDCTNFCCTSIPGDFCRSKLTMWVGYVDGGSTTSWRPSVSTFTEKT